MDVESVARLLPSGSVYAFLAEHRRELFPDAMFADLFPSRLGRPRVPADVVASVLVLQALEHRSDREAAEALTFDLRWKAAVGWPIGTPAFHPTVLTWWRRRLVRSARPDRIFDAVRALVAGQDVEPAEGGDGTDGRWQIARKVAADRVISTVDPDARHAHKTVHRRIDGFKAHIEGEPDTGLICECALTRAGGPDTGDATIGGELLARDPTVTGPVQVFG